MVVVVAGPPCVVVVVGRVVVVVALVVDVVRGTVVVVRNGHENGGRDVVDVVVLTVVDDVGPAVVDGPVVDVVVVPGARMGVECITNVATLLPDGEGSASALLIDPPAMLHPLEVGTEYVRSTSVSAPVDCEYAAPPEVVVARAVRSTGALVVPIAHEDGRFAASRSTMSFKRIATTPVSGFSDPVAVVARRGVTVTYPSPPAELFCTRNTGSVAPLVGMEIAPLLLMVPTSFAAGPESVLAS